MHAGGFAILFLDESLHLGPGNVSQGDMNPEKTDVWVSVCGNVCLTKMLSERRCITFGKRLRHWYSLDSLFITYKEFVSCLSVCTFWI